MPERRPSMTSTFFSDETASREQLVQRMAELTEILKQPAPTGNMNEYKEALAEEAAAKEVYEQEAVFLRAKNTELSERASALTSQITLIRNQRAAISAEANELRLVAGDSAAARELAQTDVERLKKELELKQAAFGADLLVERSRMQEIQRRAEEERSALQARSAAQLAEADRLRQENRALQTRLEDLGNSQSVCSLRGELKLRDIRIQDLETELDSLKTVKQDHDIEKLTHENDYLAMRLDELKAELVRQQRESEMSMCQDHEQQITTLASDVEKLQLELKEAAALSEELERTKTDLANALLRRSSSDSETRQEVDKLQAANQSLTIQVTSLSLAVTKKSDQIAELQERLSTTENQPPGDEGDAFKVKGQDARMAALSVELEEARNEVDVTKNRAHAALRQRDSAQEECQRLRSELAQLKTELKKERVCVPAEAEAQGLYDDIAELESQLRQLSAESLQRDMKNEALEAEVARLKEEATEVRLQLTQASAEKQALDGLLEEKDASAGELQEVVTELKAQNCQLKEVAETRACTSDSCDGNDGPIAEAAEKALEDAKKSFQETIAAMEAQKALASAAEHESAIMSLRLQLDHASDARKELAAQQCASERLQRELASLKQERQENEAEWLKEFRFHEDSLTAAKIARHRAESERDGLKCLLEQESSSRLKLTKQVSLLQKSVRRQQEPAPKPRVCNSRLLELEVVRSELEAARSEIHRLESLIPSSGEPTSFKSLKPVVSALVSGTFIAALCGVVM
ncbi:MAG: hypothetical protein KVP17_000224 [Porospora cf. gigantea B]|uniref:uncharacterized protein n=1 Tax=Porospora cf. gigantea B TaxID=2853592 RepID=UPI003571F8B4|nr:MAG: hypothetical protein KVP17_000224 [Porospora cf. gigantea B]